ncbi:HtaA domain-containing protein [Streptomyces mangrovisoli]|uniref:Htaa domain protein n=1 Tax=Streptomyces mangrovisoli TaxID=1428628 RepID=A0A1J4NXV8_9ACTN|nr:HtaA domain-containing protein [Streptomyces mangrovisoli]OIJ67187.1 Htaa domain protein [Streptomyces mangrovisoli]
MPACLRALITVVCTAVLGALLLPVTAAHAASRTVQGGRLDWGVKASFQSYVTGPIAKGSYSLSGGAATVGSSQFRFPSATGSYDGATGAFRASFAGAVRFVGHRTSSGAYQLDLTLSRPTVRIAGATGTLYVDVVSKAKGTGAVTTSSQVPFASLSLGGIDMKGGGTAVVLNNVPATLTAQGARSFAGYYTAGTALDPVSLAADVRPAATPTPSTTPTRTKSTTTESAKRKGTSSSGAIADGAVDWGVRRTFREYVTGDIARGTWKLTGGARDGGALFRFPSGEGTYKKGELTARFGGAVRFTGAHGLDLALSGVRVTVHDGSGTLYADVTGSGPTGENVPLVTFTAKGFTAHAGLAEVTEAPARLTARGAKAFGGMYPAGTAMDPVSLAVALTDDAELPALPDIGSVPDPSTPSATPSARPVANATDPDGDHPVLPVALGAGALLVGAAAVTAAVRRRRGRTAPHED